MSDDDVAQAHRRNSGSGIDDDHEEPDWRSQAERRRRQSLKDYRRGWQHGHADRGLGVSLTVAVSAPSAPYARGYGRGNAGEDPEN